MHYIRTSSRGKLDEHKATSLAPVGARVTLRSVRHPRVRWGSPPLQPGIAQLQHRMMPLGQLALRARRFAATMNRAILLSMAFVFLMSFSESATAAARIRVLEISICQAHFGAAVPEDDCKIPAVQHRLASLRALLGFLEATPTLLVGLPLGHYADKFGRRPILLWNVLGLVLNMCSIIVLSVLASPVFLLIGGGKYVYQAMITSIVVDASTEVQRTSNLFLVFSLYLVTSLIGPPLGALIMSQSAFTTLAFGVATMSLAFPIAMIMREKGPNRCAQRSHYEPLAQDEDGEDGTVSHEESSQEPDAISGSKSTTGTHWRSRICAAFLGMKMICIALKRLLMDPKICLAFISIILATSGGFKDILLPYASISQHWTLAKASNLLVMLAILNLFFYAFALPLLSRQLQSRLSMSTEQAAWILALSSGVPLFLGTIVIGLCANIKCLIIGLVIQSAGCGERLFLISLVSPLVEETHRARLFTSISLVDTIGQLIRAPFMELLFARSVQLEGLGRGLPFFFSGACELGAALMLWSLYPDSPARVD